MRWMRVAVLATAGAAHVAAPRALPAQDTQPAAATTPTTAPSRTIGTTVAALRGTLLDAATSHAARLEAARRLVERGSPAARDVLRGAVTAPDAPHARLAALQALAADPAPDQRLVPDLLRFVTGDEDRAVVEAAAEALAAYKGDARVIGGLAEAARDAARPVNLRIPPIRALGTMPEQAAAAALVQILTAPATPIDLANEAADALVEMTGLDDNGRDPARWDAWQRANGRRPPAEWKADLLDARAARDDRRQRGATAAAAEMRRLLERAYSATPNDAKPARLLQYLNAETPEARRVGISIASQVAATVLGGQNTPEIRQRLLELAGDADPGVRFDVITALFDINTDVEQTLAVLGPQLQVEPDARVRGAIARKLASIQRVEQALELLNHPEPEVVREAARELRRRAPDILMRDPAIAKFAAARLRETITKRAGQPRFVEARRACGEALAELRDPASMDFVPQLFGPTEPAEVRAVGLQILGELGPNAADTIVFRTDREEDPIVRTAGVTALGRSRSVAHFEWLVQKMDPRGGQRQVEVRRAARTAYERLLPYATPAKLASEASTRSGDRALRIAILNELVKQLDALDTPDALREAAVARQNIGDEYAKAAAEMEKRGDEAAKAARFAEAVTHLRKALDYYRDAKVGASVTEVLLRQLVVAMLGSKQYAELADLAGELFKDAQGVKTYQAAIGPPIRTEAERLRDRKQFDDAAALIDAALRMDPPLYSIYREDLEQIGKEVQAARRSAPAGGAPPPGGR